MKEPFKFSYTQPSLDWYEVIDVEVKDEDYAFFRLERRFGPSWWLVGAKEIDKYPYYEYTNIGRLGEENRNDRVRKFIEWAKTENGSRILQIQVIASSFDIFKEIEDLNKENSKG